MIPRSASPITVWAILVAATMLSYLSWLHAGWGNQRAAACLVLIIAFFKARLIGLHFMQLAGAAWPLRLLFEAWVILACAGLLVLFWLG